MIDIKFIRENSELVRANCIRRGFEVDIDALLKLDAESRRLSQESEALRAERNRLSKECAKDPAAREQVKQLKTVLSSKEETLAGLQEQMHQILIRMPNMLAPDVPDGQDDTGNVEIKKVGKIPTFDFKIRDHQELGELLDILDIPRGAGRILLLEGQRGDSGPVALLLGAAGAGRTRLHDVHDPLSGEGAHPLRHRLSAVLRRPDLQHRRGGSRSHRDFSADDVLDGAKLPLCYTAFTPCFRTEAGSYGKAARGIFRVHQFHKVEQIIFCKPEDSPKYHEFCLANEEYILQQLGIPYHVVNVCVGDLGAPGYKKYDIEAWFAGFGAYREVTSNTNLTSFQSRRLNIRYKDGDTRDYVHTISATAVTDRVLIAIMENFQQEDGTVIVPEVLRPLCGFDRIEPAKK